MTRYFWYISCGRILDETAHIYKVAIGESVQGSRDRFFLATYAAGHGHYFQLCSMASSNFVRRILISLRRPLAVPECCKGRDLCRLFKAAEAIPGNAGALAPAHHFRYQISLDYRCAAAVAIRAEASCLRPSTLQT